MTLRPRSGSRYSPCCRHPDETLPGICAPCIRERLSSLDSFGATAAVSDSVDLRRSRSVSVSHSVAADGEPRRNSCDVATTGISLSRLFNADDVKTNGSNADAKVESRNIGLSRVTYSLIEDNNGDGIRGCPDAFVEQNVDGEFKSMKEYIDLEFGKKNKKSKDLRDIAGNLLGAASVFSKKLRNWRQKNKVKNPSCNANQCNLGDGDANMFDCRRKSVDCHLDLTGRRSCDTEPRFSSDVGQISFEEPRASWDGYMIARSIPRLAPMFSVVENGVLGSINRFENQRLSVDRPMHSIMEDESSSGVSGLGSGHSNSDSSSSMRRSSFDRSSSVRSSGKKAVNLDEQGMPPANVKLVITERELNNWHLSSRKDKNLEKFGSLSRNVAPNTGVAGSLNPPKSSIRWNKVRNVLGFKQNGAENKLGTLRKNVIDMSFEDTNEKHRMEAGQDLSDNAGLKLTRCRSVACSRNSCEIVGSNYSRKSVDNSDGYKFKGREDFTLETNGSPLPASNDLGRGMMPFYISPLWRMRSSKSGKFELQNSHSFSGHVFHLN